MPIMWKSFKDLIQCFRPLMSCLICKAYQNQPVCTGCTHYFVPLNSCCKTCAIPLVGDTTQQCGACIQHPPAIDLVFAGYQYIEPLRTIIHQFKFNRELYLTSYLARLMKLSLPYDYKTDCIIPVPIHTKRLRERGFNQTYLLAQWLAKDLKFPLNTQLCEKIVHTVPQTTLKKQTRIKNIHRAYKAHPNQYRRVTLIDDLITTGTTANEIAKVLKKTGIQEVHLICCAKTCLN